MYIRFKTRTRERGARSFRYTGWTPLSVTLAAQVVKSERVDGEPRQRVLKHLATIRTEFIERLYPRERFWRKVNEGLDALSLDDATRARLVAQITARVPLVTAADYAANRARIAAAQQADRERWRARNGM